jgi:high-affinity K+ transport system ATPase subunit B
MFPPRKKKKKSTAGRQPYQHSKKTTKKKAKVIDKTSREQTQQRLVKMVGDGTKQITTEGKK